MTPPNRNAQWAEVLVAELAAAGLESLCLTPGSRCTPLTVAAHDHPELRTFSHLDERSSAFFALGRARRTGQPVGLVCTSGTAAANFHPAVLEADAGRVPLLVLTADRPPELRDSGANQTADQVKLYGDAVRWYRELPEPEPTDRKLRRLRVDAARAVGAAVGTPPGPVHLNVPFRKPLAPVAVPGDVATPDSADAVVADDPVPGAGGLGSVGRDGAFVDRSGGTVEPAEAAVAAVADAIATADRSLVVAGPADPPPEHAAAVADLAAVAGAPLLADPLSGLRFGPHVAGASGDASPLVCGGYDAYLSTDAAGEWPEPEVVVRFGASPTSKSLRSSLAGTGARQVLVDPAGDWREAEFAASDLLVADPAAAASDLAAALGQREMEADAPERSAYRERFATAERAHWSIVDGALDDAVLEDGASDDADDDGAVLEDADLEAADVENADPEGAEHADAELEGAVIPAVLDATPPGGALFASNSMPVRDLDRFGRPRPEPLATLGNRGVSGIDGIVSTALGAASVEDGPLVGIVGDLACYHDANGLLAGRRCDVDATLVLVNNDGGGIFHALPIEEFDPPFTEAFKTPHGVAFDSLAEAHGATHERVGSVDDLRAACERSIGRDGVDLLEVRFEAGDSHRRRESLVDALDAALAEGRDASGVD